MRNIAKFAIITGALCCFCGCSKSGNSAASAQGKGEYSPAGIKLAKTAAINEMQAYFSEGKTDTATVNWSEVAQIAERMAAKKLVAEYNENEVAADSKYKGKRVIIDGVVSQVGKDITNDVYITLSAGANPLEGVQAYPIKEKADAAGELRKGQEISVVCKVDGQMIGLVVARECESESSYMGKVAKQVEADIDTIFANGKLSNPQSEELRPLVFYTYLAGARDTTKSCDGGNSKDCQKILASVANDIKNSKLSEKELLVAKNIGIDTKRLRMVK